MDNQIKLFPEDSGAVSTEFELETANKIANEVECKLKSLCERIEVELCKFK